MRMGNNMERAINFNAAMVNAILQGRKTQTRRIMNPQPLMRKIQGSYGSFRLSVKKRNGKGYWPLSNAKDLIANECPYGQPGDRLWVRESFQFLAEYDFCPPSHAPINSDMLYVADRPDSLWDAKVRPPQFMPRWASRITLEIENVRVERLLDISEADAIAEGRDACINTHLVDFDVIDWKIAFENLWIDIYGTESWHSNPWVWVIEFKKLADKADGE